MRNLILLTLVLLVIVSISFSIITNLQVVTPLDAAYKEIFGSKELRMAIASFVSYLLSENITSYCMTLLENKQSNKIFKILVAATIGILFDSLIFTHLAFLGIFPYEIIIELIESLIIVKILITIIVCIFIKLTEYIGLLKQKQ